MNTLKNKFFVLLLFISIFTSTTFAQPPVVVNPCDTCFAPWGPEQSQTYTFTHPNKPGCIYTAYVLYRVKPCPYGVQYEITSVMFTQNTPGPGCELHCIEIPALKRIVNNRIITTLGGTAYSVAPAPCYYIAEVVAPPALRTCLGFPPGSTDKIKTWIPCDANGCCLMKLTPAGPNTYHQQVVNSTACPAVPSIPPNASVAWGCDHIGGGVSWYTCPIIPDSPLQCFVTCYDGFAKTATGVNDFNETGVIRSLKTYPNPMNDVLNISFEGLVASGDLYIELYDITGKLVSSMKTPMLKGDQQCKLDIASLPSGTYICKLTVGNDTISMKVLKQ